ncbi:zinc-binding dehydrogenase [Sphingomonas sp. IW22]|uniref:zinc-binding dehydrogenase n=1 Tax=Sphingomonas sp. IW22 TaxID=3242489 RepID=UPI003521945B
MSVLTAWQFLITQGHDVVNPLQPEQHVPVPLHGRTVLVNGAAGGVGHLALQLVKWRGARVIAVASGVREAMLRDLGADAFVDYSRAAPEDEIRDVDLVVDAVGGAKSPRFLRTLKPGGALFPIFGLGYEDNGEAARLGITVSTTQVRSSGAQLAEIAPLLNDGTLRVAIDSVYPLADASRAHERAAKGHLAGKILLKVT